MAHVEPKTISWVNSPSSDVTMHRLFVVQEAQSIDYFTSQHVDVQAPINEYEMPGDFSITDGNFRIGVAAVDAAGNISDITEKVFPFDFSPPQPPTNLTVG